MVNKDGRPRHVMNKADARKLERVGTTRMMALLAAEAALVDIGDAAATAYQNGAPISQIAELTQVSRNTIYKLLEERGITPE